VGKTEWIFNSHDPFTYFKRIGIPERHLRTWLAQAAF
jgi:hypothetical protein